MKITEILNEAKETITDKAKWLAKVKELGANELADEIGDEVYPTDIHLYAIGNHRLWGTWQAKDNVGTVFLGKGLPFDKKHRKFKFTKI